MMRYSITIGFFLLLASRIIYCTFQNSVVNAAKWNELAQKELSRTSLVIQPDRGDILACDGSVLSTTMQFYTLRMDFGANGFHWKGYVDSIDALADSLHAHFPIKGGLTAWQDSLRAPLRRKTRPRGWRLIKNISYADYQRIKEFPFFKGRRQGNNGLLAEPSKRRRLPYGDMAKLSIGVVTERKNGEVHGMSGLEYALDSLLYGKPGVAKKVNFTRGIGNWADTAAIRGWDVVSTIDIQMQDILENALLDRLQATRAEWGTALLMEVNTGEIKAICNLEEDSLGTGSGRYVEAMNRAVRGFEPGSVAKIISMMIAIEDGHVSNLDSVVGIGSSFKCFGQGRPITDSHFNSDLTIAGIIEQSSNIGMARVLSRFYKSPQQWHDRLARIGFLDRLKSGIGEEMPARYPVVPLDRGGLVTLSRQFYGYGMEIPPLHTLSLYNAIANNGKYVRPRLVKALRRDGVDSIIPVDYVVPQACSERTARKMQQMLSLVVNGKHGTARSLAKGAMVTLAGKTGTCYTVGKHGYDTSRKRLAFCGYFPAEAPKYSCMVLIYHPRQEAFGAASTSGVVLRDVANALYSRGLLDNSSDFRADIDPNRSASPVVYSSKSSTLPQDVAQLTGAKISHRIGADQQNKPGHVPGLYGMGLREAVNTLERAGYEVAYRGSGYVRSQTPAAGEKASAGTKVTLQLSE